MTEDLENQLRNALRPVPAPEGLAERILKALPAREPPAPVVVMRPRGAPPRRGFWMPVSLAASLVLAVVLGQHVATDVQRRNEQAAGRAASRELMQALRLTSDKLDLAYEAVRQPPPQPNDEEKRS